MGRGGTNVPESYLYPLAEEVSRRLNKVKESLNASPDVMDYWDTGSLANISYVTNPKSNSFLKTAKLGRKRLGIYRKLWTKAGSKGKKGPRSNIWSCSSTFIGALMKR